MHFELRLNIIIYLKIIHPVIYNSIHKKIYKDMVKNGNGK